MLGCGFSPASAQTCPPGQTAEFCAAGNLAQINAAAAYTLGLSGKGVNVGVVDLGFDATNLDLVGKVSAGILFNGSAVDFGPLPLTGQLGIGSHGTAVADIAVAAQNGVGIQGVAFNSPLFVAVPTVNSITDAQIAAATTWMVSQGVKVINYSLGSDSCQIGQTAAQAGKPCNVGDYNLQTISAANEATIPAARAAVSGGALLVFATGNEGQPNPDSLGGLPTYVSGLSNGWLVVGAVDSNNVVTDYSNRCGVMALYCLVAPGNIMAPVGANGALASEQGTSFATPAVTGAAAVVAQAFPWFSNTDLQQTLLTTATPLGSRVGNLLTQDTAYGWGLLNVGAAVRGYGGFVNNSPTLNTQGMNATFANNIYGNAGFTKAGAGTLTLSGVSTYTGPTNVSGGSLAVTGSIVSAVNVLQGGAFGGSGSVGATTVNGTLGLGQPNNLTINGGLTFGSTGAFVASVLGATADRVSVNGAASLAGAIQVNGLGGAYTFNSPYTLISATSGVTGAFANQVYNFGVGINASVSYNPNNVLLTLQTKALTPAATTPASPAASEPAKIAAAIDTAVKNGANPAPLFPIYNEPTSAALDAGLDQLSGEVHTTVAKMAFTASGQFLDAMMDPAVARAAVAPAPVVSYAPDYLVSAASSVAIAKSLAQPQTVVPPPYRAWATVLGDSSRVTGSAAAGSTTASLNTFQFAGGVETDVTRNAIMGVAAAEGSARSSLANNLGSASANIGELGVYGRLQNAPWTLSGAGSFTWLNVSTQRSITALGLNSVTAKYNETAFSARVEAAYEIARFSSGALSPFGNLQIQSARNPNFTETAGGAAAGVSVAGQTNVTSRSVVGMDMQLFNQLGSAPVSGFARVGWSHYFSQGNTLSASLANLNGANFVVVGARMSNEAALISLGAKLKPSPNITASLRFDDEVSRGSQQYYGEFKLEVAF